MFEFYFFFCYGASNSVESTLSLDLLLDYFLVEALFTLALNSWTPGI